MTTASGEANGRKPYDLTGAAHDYLIREGPPRQTLLICTHPRSGSTLLGEALYFAGGLGCPLEYFHAGFRPGLAARWRTATLDEHIRAVHRFRTDPGGTLAVKLFWSDIAEMAAELAPARFSALPTSLPEELAPETYRAIAAVLAPVFPNPRFLHLWRGDRLRMAVSGLSAMQTGLWRVIPEAGLQAPRGPVDYDPARIERYIAHADWSHRHWRNFFAAIGVSAYPVTYEALTTEYAPTVAALLAHLGSGAAIPPVRMQRQSNAANEAIVLRYLRDRAAR